MDIKRFMEEMLRCHTGEDMDRINARMAIHAVRKDEPIFLVQRYSQDGFDLWMLVFDDAPDLWLRVETSREGIVRYCAEFQLSVAKVDEDYRH